MTALAVHDDDNSVPERARLACLRSLQILDTAPDARLDAITQSAARHFDVPVALVSIIDENRQWFKSKIGLDTCETHRDHAFCNYTIRKPDVMVVENALYDERFKDNPLVTGEPNIRFYAGAPITIDEEHRIGTLCLIDDKPRTFGDEQQAALRSMARLVERIVQTQDHTRAVLGTLSETVSGPDG